MNRPSEYSRETARRSTSWRMLADTATVGGWTAAVKVAGAVKVILAARLFGAGDAMDAFLIAFLLPAFFMDLLAGPLDSALIPALIELRQKQGRAAAEALYSQCAGGCRRGVYSRSRSWPPRSPGCILPLLAPSFAPEKLALTKRLLLVMIAVVPFERPGCHLARRAELRTSIRVFRRRAANHAARFHRCAAQRRANNTA